MDQALVFSIWKHTWEGFREQRAFNCLSQVFTPTPYQNLETRNFQWEVEHELGVVGLSLFLSPFFWIPQIKQHVLDSLFLFWQSQVGPWCPWFSTRRYKLCRNGGWISFAFVHAQQKAWEIVVDWNMDCFVSETISTCQKSLSWWEYLELGLHEPFSSLMWAQR